ncbi:MAG: ABC transporter ATP-binding protein [Pseudomonadota bacterium]
MSESHKDHGVNDDVAINVEGVSKSYTLWSSPHARLQKAFLDLGRRILPLTSRINGQVSAEMDEHSKVFHALHDVSFQIKKGESWGVIGTNGSGKSTLLKMVSGNLRPSTGRIVVDGSVALLDYSSGLHGEFTGRENVYLKAAMMGLSRRETDEKYDSIAAFADIGEFIDQPVKTYSSGMTARLGFAIIAHTNADIIISDEALAVGDAFFVQKCMDYLRGFLKRGTFLFVSHATSDVVSLCEKAVWLERGRIKAIGSSKEVAEAYLSRQAMDNSQRYLEKNQVSKESDDKKKPYVELGPDEFAQHMDAAPARVVKDGRNDFLNLTQWRNDIKIPDMEMDEGFGIGGATINEVSFEDLDGNALTWVVGGEMGRLRILATAERDIAAPIVGFQVMDRLGQPLFADNTYFATLETPFSLRLGQKFTAEFDFQMPLLPVGDYGIRAAIADGEQDDAAMLHCVPTALVFRSTTSSVRHGLVGVPMQRIRLELSSSRGPLSNVSTDGTV